MNKKPPDTLYLHYVHPIIWLALRPIEVDEETNLPKLNQQLPIVVYSEVTDKAFVSLYGHIPEMKEFPTIAQGIKWLETVQALEED